MRQGSRLFSKESKSDGPVKLQVGIDFGTSSTKVAYGPREKRVRKIKPMIFDHSAIGYPNYCLPSVVAIGNDDRLLFGMDAVRFLKDRSYLEGIHYLKTVFACTFDEKFQNQQLLERYQSYLVDKGFGELANHPDYLVVAYLSYVVTTVREKLEREFEGRPLDVAYNICIPIDQIESSALLGSYEKVFALVNLVGTSWDLRYSTSDLLEIIKDLFPHCEYEEEAEENRLFWVPEALAQVTSYLVSLQSSPGIHAVVDIGAGTTDVSIFSLPLEHEEKFRSRTDWYAAEYVPRGTGFIASELVKAIVSDGKKVTNLEVEELLMQANELEGSHRKILYEKLKYIWTQSKAAWQTAYGRRRIQSDWEKENVRVFITGGGSELPYATEIFSESWMQDWGPYKTEKLPIPLDYEEFDTIAPFNRMAVAYGLAIPKAEISEHVLPKDCPDQTPPKKRVKPRRSHEDMYTKR